MARTAILGGTFDPVHNTHLAIALAAANTFGLKKVLFVPAGNPPLKSRTQASWHHRLKMLELAVAAAGDPRFEVSEIEQPAADGARSYSILTVEKLLQKGLGPLSFIVGADAFADIGKWRRAEELARLVEFIVVPRPGCAYVTPPGATVRELPAPLSPDSSSAVRASLRAGSPAVPVPEPVLGYIRQHGLYQSQEL